jgi:multidrug efflux pump subunit AcrB
MTRNSVAANLLMFVIFIGGALGVLRMKQEIFPEFDLDMVTISVPYPGASPTEVEQGIVLAAEEAVRGVDGVKRVTSRSSENMGTVSAELLIEADPDKALADLKAAIDRITSFPEEAEKPNVTLVSRRRAVISLVISGEQPLQTLHAIAEKARARLLDHDDITAVDITGVPATEISIEMPRGQLEGFGLTPQQVAQQVAQSSVELPGGELETEGGEMLVRVADRLREGHEFGDIILRSTADGAILRLGDVAEVTDGYADDDKATAFNGKNAVRLTAYRIGDETPKAVSAAVREYAEGLKAELPDTVSVDIWGDDSEMLVERIDLLMDNAIVGLALVLLILTLFLEVRLALWVAVGIPISFLGAFLIMPLAGVSINMVSLFGFIVTLGLVVDDAIIVGEHAFSKMQHGLKPTDAAVEGAREMAVPVTFAVLTSMAAFSPLLFVPGVMGKIFAIFPVVVCSVLFFSLVESFFILPAHVAHIKAGPPSGVLAKAEKLHHWFGGWLESFTFKVYRPLLEKVLHWRYTTLAVALSTIFLTVGLLAGGLVPFSFFPELEGDRVSVTVRMPFGAPPAAVERARRLVESGAEAAIEEIGGDIYVRGMFTQLGSAGGRGHMGAGAESGGHLVSVEVNLVPSGERPFTSADFGDTWRRATPDIPGAQALVFKASSGPGAGEAVDMQLSHTDTAVLARASGEVAETLRGFSQLTSVENGYASGKPQLDFHLTPAARTLGLTASDIARQLRSSFFGAEAVREQRGRNEMRVMIRLPAAQRASEADLEELRIRAPSGAMVPLSHVATFERGRAPTTIDREDGRRVVNVKAKLALGVPSAQPVMDVLRGETIPALRAKYPDLSIEMVGQQREQRETFASLGQNYLLALFVIFALLAVPFRSYAQPLVIMVSIPLGFVGAVTGHLIMGYEMSLISMFGVIALSGVVVNDSLVLLDATNRARAGGKSAHEAIVFGGMRRLRPILLTSLTTFFGLLPMIFETSMQARFLIPMAISLGFGVLFATGIALLVVPALYMSLEDLRGIFGFDDPRDVSGPRSGSDDDSSITEITDTPDDEDGVFA